MKNQGKYPYCTLYAMSTFLEIWREEMQDYQAEKMPALDPAFFALAYNLEAAPGDSGTTAHWLTTIVAKWGALPEGAKPQDPTVEWPVKHWRKKHLSQMPEAATRKILSSVFTHPSVPFPFTGKEYLEKVIQIQFQDLTLKRIPLNYYFGAETETSKEDLKYRYRSRSEAEKHISEMAREQGIEPTKDTEPKALYQALVAQLYRYRPVLVGVNAGLTFNSFRSYKGIDYQDLVLENPDAIAMHSMVAVAHCDRNNRNKRFCPDNDIEGIVLQNSGGDEVNNSGYVFVEKDAVSEILEHVLVDKY